LKCFFRLKCVCRQDLYLLSRNRQRLVSVRVVDDVNVSFDDGASLTWLGEGSVEVYHLLLPLFRLEKTLTCFCVSWDIHQHPYLSCHPFSTRAFRYLWNNQRPSLHPPHSFLFLLVSSFEHDVYDACDVISCSWVSSPSQIS